MNIQIRKYKDTDALGFYHAVIESHQHVSKWLPWCNERYSFEDAKIWVESADAVWNTKQEYRFIIENIDSGEILGSVDINQIITQHKIGNLGYWIRKSALNHGVCQQASKLVLKYAFEQLGLNRIEINVLPDNVESNSVAIKLGVFEGLNRNKLFHSGKSLDANCYSVIPDDYN